MDDKKEHARKAWDSLSGQWKRSLKTRNLAPRTIKGYPDSLTKLETSAVSQGLTPLDVQRSDIESFFEELLEKVTRFGRATSPSTAAMDHRQLRVFFNWLADVEDVDSPMQKVAAPKVPESRCPSLPRMSCGSC